MPTSLGLPNLGSLAKFERQIMPDLSGAGIG